MILLTGASGFFGKIAWRIFSASQAVYGVCRTQQCGGRFFSCELTDRAALGGLLARVQPGVIVHAAALRDPNQCERRAEYAQRLHVTCTAQMAQWCRAHQACLVYISTDYVFDGTAPPYAEDAPPSPISVYGRTKADGEAAARQAPEHLIVRMPLQYGYSQPHDDSFVLKVLAALRGAAPLEIDDVQIRYPTLSNDVAHAILALLARGVRGVVHLRAPSRMTRYAMWREMARVFELPCGHVRPAPQPVCQTAPRPADSQLGTARYDALGLPPFHDFNAGLRLVRAAMEHDGYEWRTG